MAKKSTSPVSRPRAANLKSSLKTKNDPKKIALKSGSDRKATSQKSTAGSSLSAVRKTGTTTAAKSKSAPKIQAPLKTHSKTNTSPERAPTRQKTKQKHPRRASERMDSVVFERTRVGARSSLQSGDLQGLSKLADADSESVDELLEEGNAFEAGIVKGVEDSPYPEEGDIRTRELPEDDVPEEYLDES